MSDTKVDVDPGEPGFDPFRLSRIDQHFDRYPERESLTSWSAVVTRNVRS